MLLVERLRLLGRFVVLLLWRFCRLVFLPVLLLFLLQLLLFLIVFALELLQLLLLFLLSLLLPGVVGLLLLQLLLVALLLLFHPLAFLILLLAELLLLLLLFLLALRIQRRRWICIVRPRIPRTIVVLPGIPGLIRVRIAVVDRWIGRRIVRPVSLHRLRLHV